MNTGTQWKVSLSPVSNAQGPLPVHPAVLDTLPIRLVRGLMGEYGNFVQSGKRLTSTGVFLQRRTFKKKKLRTQSALCKTWWKKQKNTTAFSLLLRHIIVFDWSCYSDIPSSLSNIDEIKYHHSSFWPIPPVNLQPRSRPEVHRCVRLLVYPVNTLCSFRQWSETVVSFLMVLQLRPVVMQPLFWCPSDSQDIIGMSIRSYYRD